MGVLNVTPDSFYDGGRFHTFSQALSQARKMIAEGADYIDVGGESTRPGAHPLSTEEECSRVIPIIEAIKKESNIPISIDTRRAEVMKAALMAGATYINDVSALQLPGALEVAAEFAVPVCLMHMKGTPQTMQDDPQYDDIFSEITDFFVERIAACEKAGILRENIEIDPGFGFGKTMTHNFQLLGNLSYFKKLGCPIVVGLSRKSMFGKLLNCPVEERLSPSLAGAVIAAQQGAKLIRTHDVKETKVALAVVTETQKLVTTHELICEDYKVENDFAT